MRKIGVITVGRSDFSLYIPLLKRIQACADTQLLLYVTGMHFSSKFGRTVEVIQQEGFPIEAEVEVPIDSDTPQGIAETMGRITMGFASIFTQQKPDILIVLGDRFEMHAAALAAVPFNIPLAHIAGGALTEGLFDEYFRHSLTKMSHLHFVGCRPYAERLGQMGEASWRITTSGALGAENAVHTPLYSIKAFREKFLIDLSLPTLLVTFHPVTLAYDQTSTYISNLLNALCHFKHFQIIFTSPNSDTSGNIVIQKISAFVKEYENTFFLKNFNRKGYLSLLQYVKAMVGNSSSGIIEAPSFKLPVVNVGPRQQGRLRAANVIDVDTVSKNICQGIEKACTAEFKASLEDLKNPYGQGEASQRIMAVLANIDLKGIIIKKFQDNECVNSSL